jgi:hypothetical protein
MVSHVSHSGACTSQGNIYQGGPGWIEDSPGRMVGDGLTCFTFSACTIQRNTFTPRWARIVEPSRMVGVVSHVSTFGACTKNTFAKGGAG